MDTREYLQRLDAACAELGFGEREMRSSGHWSVVHQDNETRVFFPATPGDRRGMLNVIAELERAAGKRLAKQAGYRGGKRARGYQRSVVHEKADSELEARAAVTVAHAQIAALDTIIDGLVNDSENPHAERDHIIRLLTERALCENTLRHYNRPATSCAVPGLAALQAEWSPARDDIPCSAEHVELLKKSLGRSPAEG